MTILEQIGQAIEGGKLKDIAGLVEEAIALGFDPEEILNKGMIGPVRDVGKTFERTGEFSLMLLASVTMKAGLNVLQGHFDDGKLSGRVKIIIGTVAGDLHDIGKGLVANMLQGGGYNVIDLGVDVEAERFLQTLEENPDCSVLALSSLLTTTMPRLEETVKLVRSFSKWDNVKIMVGGAPLTEMYAKSIGADIYTEDAYQALEAIDAITQDNN